MSFIKKYGVSRSKVLNVLVVVLLLVFLVSATLYFINLWESKNEDFQGSKEDFEDSVLTFEGNNYVLKQDVETYLFLGLDKFETEEIVSYNNDKRADFLMLLVVDNKNSEFSALHINRDTMTDFNVLGVAGDKIGSVNKQIALSHTYGNGKEISCRNTANAVSNLLNGIKIDHYVSVTMDAVPKITDLVGGVEVEVLDDFSGVDDTLVAGQKVLLTGEHALNYVRTRYNLDDSSNENRMKRQKQYLEALYSKIKQSFEQNADFIDNSVLELTEYTVSDCSVNRLQTLGERISTFEFVGIKDFEGEYVVGEKYMEFYPDKQSITATNVELFYELQK